MSDAPTIEQVETLRDLFLKKYEKEPPSCGSFHSKDIERVKTNNFYLQICLEHMDLDMKQSLQMLWDCLVWRKTFGANDINESNIRMDYLNQGIMFPHNYDKDGKTLLIFKIKSHTKGSKDMGELIRVVVYWIERLMEENGYDKITVFFDMQGTSVGNIEMDFIKKIIETLKQYPKPLNYILIYEMPWILNAAFKIIKALLPPKAVAILKFINQKNITEFIDENNLLTSWGGKDNYTFSFQPAQPKNSNHIQKSLNNNENDFEFSPTMKKVHFANSSPTRVPMSDAEEHLTPHDEEMLRITPTDTIILNRVEGANDGEVTGSVDITCTSKYPVTYKIKTTSPFKFRVRPSSGALNPGATISINVILQPGKEISSASKDKFLVMYTALPEGIDVNNNQFVTEFWKALPPSSSKVQQHRLQCVIAQNAQGEQMRNGHMHGSGSYADESGERKNTGSADVAQLSDSLNRIEQQMRLSVKLHWLSLMVFIIVSIALTYIIKQEIQEQNPDSCPTSSRF